MNKIIFETILKRFNSNARKHLTISLTYYCILALLPTILILSLITSFFNISIIVKHDFFYSKDTLNFVPNIIFFATAIYLISRVFSVVYRQKNGPIKSFVISLAFSLISISFLTIFIFTFTIKSTYIKLFLQFMILCFFLFIIIRFFSYSSSRYALIFSAIFSPIAILLIYGFALVSQFFINYENLYGILSPLFLFIFLLNILINVASIFYISSEEFTKISKIKFIKT